MCFLCGLELLSASCGFDSRWEHSNGHEPCKKRDNMDCASLLADNLYYLFFYRATPAMKKTEDLRGGMIATGMVFI